MTATLRRLAFVIIFLAVCRIASAQEVTVRVVKDQAVIWQPNFSTYVTTVRAGTVLEVVARRGDWFQVVLPYPAGTRDTGMIAVSQVETAGSSPTSSAQQLPRSAAKGRSDVHGFAEVSYGAFNASHTFDTLLGTSDGFWVGGGIRQREPSGLFTQVAVDFFRKNGRRVFVFGNEVFDLGISDTVTIVPMTLTVGYQMPARTLRPYIGGGAGEYLYRETFAGDDVTRWIVSYHGLAGVEWRSSGRFGTAVEIEYSYVPNHLAGELGDAFNEHDLGGFQAKIKLLFGGR